MRQAPAVSIHVPLAEHDEILRPAVEECLSFNSRAPRGARLFSIISTFLVIMFQFTCPSRSTTDHQERDGCRWIGFNSRAPRGARPP